MNLSEEERQRRRERAIELHRAGKIGGQQFGKLGGRPRKPRASEVLAQKIRGDAEEMYQALKRGLRPQTPQSVVNDTVRTMLSIEEKEEQRVLDEARQAQELQRDQLLAVLADKLERLRNAGVPIPSFDVEGEVTGEDDGTAGELPSAA